MTTDTTENEASPPSPPLSPSKKRRAASLPDIEVDLALPEPPSKKARRAIKRGKPLRPAGDGDEDGAEDGSGDNGDGEDGKKESGKKARSPHGVWIGNLPFTVTKAALRRWLVDSSGGAIADEAITRVHMPTPKKKAAPAVSSSSPATATAAPANKGFAYVDFSTYETAVAAVALSESALGGRRLLIKNSSNFEGRPEPPAAVDGTAEKNGKKGSTDTAREATKIFVGNLGYGVGEDELRAHFEKCGPVRWVKVATFEDTGKCKGFGWVSFEGAEAAAWAVKGFVKIREAVETVEDFMEEEEKTREQEAPRKTKTRKWWVNQLQGRPLKIELAEDDQLRYKKRFGKGAREPGGRKTDGSRAEEVQPDARKAAETPDSDSLNFHGDVGVARLTGAAVKPTGKKVTFD